MADVILSYTIQEAKVAKAMQGFLKLHPNTEFNDPGDPAAGLKYTDAQWVKEKIRRKLVSDIRRGLQVISNEGAIVPEDDTIVEIT